MLLKKLVYITRPIVPPWDEGSKNLAISLASKIKLQNLEKYILTTNKKFLLDKEIKRFSIFPNPKLNVLNKIRLALFLIKNDFDILHFIFVATPITSLIIKIILFFKKTKSIQTIVSLKGNPILYGTKIVCFSKITAEKIKRERKVGIEVVPPAVDTQKFTPGIKKNKIAFLGELYRTQSYKIISRLAKKLAQSLPKYEIIFGFRCSNELKNEPVLIKKLQKELKKYKNIKWENTIENMPKFLKDVKLIIFPAEKTSEKFDFPLVLIEGLSCGVPSIVSPIGPLNEFSKYKGIIKPNKNTAGSFLKKIRLILKQGEYNKLSKIARKTAIRSFSIYKIAKDYEKIYEDLINN